MINRSKRAFAIKSVCFFALAALTLPVRAQQISPNGVKHIPRSKMQVRPWHPFPQHVTYAPGTIRPDHRPQAEQDADLIALYEAWKTRYLVPAGTEPDGHPRYRILHHRAGGDTVSEGMGYGMMIVAYMAGHEPDARTIFDGLYEYVLDHPSVNGPGLMDWDVPADESPNPPEEDSAFDGDADIAFSLLVASAQWGNRGRFNYRAESRRVLDAIMLRTVGEHSNLALLGDWVNEPGDEYNEYDARTSDFMPDHFHAFARATGDNRWNQVAAACAAAVEHLQTVHSPGVGLIPDFLVPVSGTDHTPKPAPAFFIEGPNDGRYEYNACRDPWRLATDALVNNDPDSRRQALRIAQWSRANHGNDPQTIHAGYKLDGTPVAGSNYFSTAFAAPMAVGAMLDPDGQAWLNALYDSIRGSDDDYYEDTLSVLCMLVLTGNWWDPTLLP